MVLEDELSIRRRCPRGPRLRASPMLGSSQNLHSPSGVRTWICAGLCPSSEKKWNRYDPIRRTGGMLKSYHARITGGFSPNDCAEMTDIGIGRFCLSPYCARILMEELPSHSTLIHGVGFLSTSGVKQVGNLNLAAAADTRSNMPWSSRKWPPLASAPSVLRQAHFRIRHSSRDLP